MKKIGFVTPWYGADLKGGAETDLYNLVRQLHKRNIPVEILTTCVKEASGDWAKNVYPKGFGTEDGILVRRFPADNRDSFLFSCVNYKLTQGQRVLSDEDEKTFTEQSINSSELYRYIREHADEYEAFGFIPYLFGTTYYGVQQCPEKSFLIPCFHDEAYVYLRCFHRTYSAVAGMAFHSEPEAELAEKCYHTENMKLSVVGSGMNTDITADGSAFRDKYRIDGPFILYAGRKDKGKNVHTLIDYFLLYREKKNPALQLVLIGGGEIDIPKNQGILDLGFVSAQDKYHAMAAAEFLCQPSKNESFSLVIMESWLCKRPVVVCEECKVTTDFVKKAQGGLYFKDYADFSKVTEYLLSNKETAAQMGQNGSLYVTDHFSWDKVAEKYADFVSGLSAG